MNTGKRIRKAILAFLGASVLLVASVLIAQTQNRPSTLTPSPESAAPGATIRVDLVPGLDSMRLEDISLVLCPARAQGANSDVVLRILEYHGDWLRARIPQNTSPELGAARLFLLDLDGNVLASSGNRFFRILAGSPPLTKNPAPTPGSVPRSGQEEVRARVSMTTPGVTANAKRLPTQIADYVVIVDEAIELRGPLGRQRDLPSIRLTFTLPNDAILDDRVVLAYMMNPTGEHPNNPQTAHVLVNGQLLEDYEFREGTNRGMWKAFRGHNGILRHGENTIEFRCFTGEEKLTIDDVVLWFHRQIEW